MLRESPAFSGFAVPDIAAAKAFYGDVLGLAVSEIPEAGLLQIDVAGGRPVLVYPKPEFVPATYTILNFPVDDVEATVRALGEKGVTFERYDGFGQDELGIARGGGGPAIAWFTDPAGNVLSVLEEPPG
jgi:catechol 2,3-dioxygenase-like lactoylglutathione lyase family enzyme